MSIFRSPCTYEDVVSRLGGKRFLTILDQKDSFWQVELDEDSSHMRTFNTPFSRYRFRGVPFGISCASEVLQKRTYKAFGDIEGVHVIADDMIIAAATEEEHDQILLKVLKRTREQNIKFNPSKIQFKVTAILNMPEPQSKEDVRRLIGMLNYSSPYIPNMSAVTAPIRDLLKKETQFSWLQNIRGLFKLFNRS